jgi:hypothetical protein
VYQEGPGFPNAYEDVMIFSKGSLKVPEILGQDTPPVSFSSRMRKVNAHTFSNLYDVSLGKSKKAEAAEVIRANRSILQRLVTAYDTKRPVDLKEIAARELMSVPITIC